MRKTEGRSGEVALTSERFACPRLDTVNGSVCDCPPKPRLPTEKYATGAAIVSRAGIVARTGLSVTVKVSFTATVKVLGGGVGGAVLVPAPLSGTVWVKFAAAGVLVRLLRAALSVKVIEPLGIPEDGAT